MLPPFGSTDSPHELWYRRRALQTLAKMLTPPSQSRVRVMNMWSAALGTGVYVHAKCQTYDENLLVCGSANMNRRSTECDAELDCAVLDTTVVRTHLANLYACLTGQPWSQFAPGWLHDFWVGIDAKTSQTLIPDPFWAQVQNPHTPNGVPMPCTGPGVTSPESVFEPTSAATKIRARTRLTYGRGGMRCRQERFRSATTGRKEHHGSMEAGECQPAPHARRQRGRRWGTERHLRHGTRHVPVSGSWAASGSLPGRNASAFSFSGAVGDPAPTFVAAVGIMIGPGPSPTQINLRMSESASTNGSLTKSTATLLPGG